jgi:serine/threonine protein phosphatase PrpC
MVEIKNCFSYTGIGKRSSNEDFFTVSSNNFFVLCDGVGGAEKGEIASGIVVNVFKEEYEQNIFASPEDALRVSEFKFSEFIESNPDSMGMATTLTFTKLCNDGLTVAWIGDSRVYQIRNGKIIFQTADHSWVNEALKAGILTEEEAVGHPKSNIITRAVQGNHKPVEIDVELIEDLHDNDFIFHCSDGVLEAWTNDEIEILFSENSEAQVIIEKIKLKCAEFSKDNNTAILYQIKSTVSQKLDLDKNFNSSKDEDTVDAIPLEQDEVEIFQKKQIEKNIGENNLSTKSYNKSLLIFALLIILAVIFYNILQG